MSGKVQFTARFRIREGKLDEFIGVVKEATGRVRDNEPGMLGYQWYLNPTSMECTLIEQYESNEYITFHRDNMVEQRAKFMALADVVVDAYGEVGSEVRVVYDAMGVTYHDYVEGFTRY